MSAAKKKIAVKDCWNQIGVWGHADEKCSILKQVVHCQNCSVYSEAGRSLLNQETPKGYQEEWRKIYQNEKVHVNSNQQSIIVFRLGHEWFGLPISVLEEITDITSIHSIPHRRNKILRGMVNIRGTLQLCISLGALFSVERHNRDVISDRIVHERMMVIERDGEKYVFPASEVHNVQNYTAGTLKDPPSTISRATGTFITGVLEIEKKRVGVIDADLLFHAIQRNML